MSRALVAQPLSAEGFAGFGDVLDTSRGPDWMINEGLCARHHDRARLAFVDGAPGISLFEAEPRALPYLFDLVERHPLGSQAFIPMGGGAFLVIVAPDLGGHPGRPLAFRTAPGQAVNLHRGIWHGVLTPLAGPGLAAPGLFAVVDRVGAGANLDEHRYDAPWVVTG